MPGAMPFLHRRWGNPMFSLIARWWFRATIHDVYCGLRGFTKDAYGKLHLQCTGMEFAIEMVVRASLAGLAVGEVPITLHPGWPNEARAAPADVPGWLAHVAVLPAVQSTLALSPPGTRARGAGLRRGRRWIRRRAPRQGGARRTHAALRRADDHRRLSGSDIRDPHEGVCNQRVVAAGRCAHAAVREGRLARTRTGHRYCACVVGVSLLIRTIVLWAERDFGNLDYPRTLRIAIPGVLATVVGLQTIFFVFFAGVLQLDRRPPAACEREMPPGSPRSATGTASSFRAGCRSLEKARSTSRDGASGA